MRWVGRGASGRKDHLESVGQAVDLDFGDGDDWSLSGGGTGRVYGTRPHVYQEAGTYSAIATVTDISGGLAADTVTITVN